MITKDDMNAIRGIEDKYGLPLFGMALVQLADVGFRHFSDVEAVAMNIKQIEAKGEEDAAKGISPIITTDFQIGIIRCAAELARFSILTVFAYIKKHVHITL